MPTKAAFPKIALSLAALALVATCAVLVIFHYRLSYAEVAAYASSLQKYRGEKDLFFRVSSRSPLVHSELFRGLAYYPAQPALRFKLRLLPLPDTATQWLATNLGTPLPYRQAGWVQIPKTPPAKGVSPAIILYPPAEPKRWLLAFKDETSGEETSPLGRYLEVEPVGQHHVWVDFNLAYHPYCVYNPALACPEPPTINNLPFPIKAGERLAEALP